MLYEDDCTDVIYNLGCSVPTGDIFRSTDWSLFVSLDDWLERGNQRWNVTDCGLPHDVFIDIHVVVDDLLAHARNLRVTRRFPMNKKYIVRLTDEERQVCTDVIKKLKGTSQKVRRAQILLKSDADGPAWSDVKIAEAFNCRVQTIENLRKRLVTESFELALNGKKHQTPPIQPLLDGKGEAKLISMRLGKPPAGYGRWTLQLLADELVALEVVESICQETVRQTLKKTV